MPTYNYGRYIETALESIRSQSDARVEVLVLDGGSTDETPAIVRSMAERWPNLRYVRQEQRGGIDADMARSVELARGDYCWLLSADDALQPGTVQRMLQEFEAGYGLILGNRIWCDSELSPLGPHAWLKDSGDGSFDFADRSQTLAYLNAAQSLGALFSFMSCIGFKRATWMRTPAPAAVPNYTHVGRLFRMAREGAKLRYIAAPLVLCRGGMDSFRAGGFAGRLLIDLRGYRQLAQALFPDDAEARAAFMAVMRREHPLRRWFDARLQTPDAMQWATVESELRHYDFSGAQLWAVRHGRPVGKLLTLVRNAVKSA
jgi:abequosyltransferase